MKVLVLALFNALTLLLLIGLAHAVWQHRLEWMRVCEQWGNSRGFCAESYHSPAYFFGVLSLRVSPTVPGDWCFGVGCQVSPLQ